MQKIDIYDMMSRSQKKSIKQNSLLHFYKHEIVRNESWMVECHHLYVYRNILTKTWTFFFFVSLHSNKDYFLVRHISNGHWNKQTNFWISCISIFNRWIFLLLLWHCHKSKFKSIRFIDNWFVDIYYKICHWSDTSNHTCQIKTYTGMIIRTATLYKIYVYGNV